MGHPRYTVREAERRHQQLVKVDPRLVVKLARAHTSPAITKLVKLMNNVGPDGQEGTGMIPVAVQMRCAEILLERGWGKAPVSIALEDGTAAGQAMGALALPIMQRIAAIRAAAEGKPVLDLEASEVREMLPAPPADDLEDIV